MPADYALYVAVRCQKNSEHVILLTCLEFDPGGHSQTFVQPRLIEAQCNDCKTVQLFENPRLIVCKGPLPSETFQTHPAFRE
jgi:hypothetical protein